MNAQLKPIEARCVGRPRYDNTHVTKGALWMRDNDAALKGYYADLGGRLPKPEDDNITAFGRAQKFLSFAACQWDRERMAL